MLRIRGVARADTKRYIQRYSEPLLQPMGDHCNDFQRFFADFAACFLPTDLVALTGLELAA